MEIYLPYTFFILISNRITLNTSNLIILLQGLTQYTSKGKAVPLEACSGPEGSRKLRFPDFMTTAHDAGKVVSLTHRPPLPPGNTPGTHFCWRLSRLQGHSATGRIISLKIPMKSSGIKLATCQFVAQCLNHYATARPNANCNTLN